MAVSIKTAREIELMRQSARLLEDVFAVWRPLYGQVFPQRK